MRIGTNHGSLSDRIMSYFGDSPRGMVNNFSSKFLLLFFHDFFFDLSLGMSLIKVLPSTNRLNQRSSSQEFAESWTTTILSFP